jgi:hypothetical protein
MKDHIFNAGDIVAYRASFLRSICDHSHKSASRRFKVISFESYGPGFTIVQLKCTTSGEEIGCNSKNLILETRIHLEAN